MTEHSKRKLPLAAVRKAAGLTQKELSKKLGVSRRTVTKWETGESKMKPVNLYAICYICGFEADEIFLPTESTKSEQC